ncbi:MAG: ABC transporter permease [bacterium]|nr:ABC transporter permease [bacterium]
MSSFTIISLKRLIHHKQALFAIYILLFLYLLAAFAEFFAPYPLTWGERDKAYHPPTKIYIFEKQGFCRPFIYNYQLILTEDYEKVWYEKRDVKYPIRLFVRDENGGIHLFGTDKPSSFFLLGSDWNGRDILSRLIYGSRISLSIGIIGVFISFFLGMLVGGIAGYFGGWIDTVIMRFIELIMSFPAFYLILSLRAIFPLSLSSIQVYLMIVIIMSLIGWGGVARVIRGMVLSLREMEFVLAQKALGASPFRIITQDILPNTTSFCLVSASLSIPDYILGESVLSLLGLGINEPQPSWGNMLARAMDISTLSSYPWILAPGFAIFITVICFNLLSDGLRDCFDPKSFVGKL